MHPARAIASYLVHPDARRDDHALCARCRCLSSDLSDEGMCPGCVEVDVEADALRELDALTSRWVRVNGRPTRDHVAAVGRARSESVLSGVARTGWVSL